MKKGLKLFVLFAGCIVFMSCGDDDAQTIPPVMQFETMGSWNCELDESCQDVYEIQINSGSSTSINVDQVTGSSVVRLAVYAPGVVLAGATNLLTGNSNDLECNGQDESASVPNFMATAGTGVYKFVVTRDWGSSQSRNGTYRLLIFSNQALEFREQIVDDVDSLAPTSECN